MDCPAGLRFEAELDPGTVLLAGEFPGVAQQILERNPQELVISLSGQSRSDLPIHGAVRLRVLQFGQDGFGQAAEIGGVPGAVPRRRPRPPPPPPRALALLPARVPPFPEVFL